MMYKVVFLDIDGTILMPDHRYSPMTKEAIGQLQAQGIFTFIATGRPLHEIKPLMDDLNIASAVGFNGAYAEIQGETIVNDPFKKETVEEIVETAKRNEHDFVLYTNGKNYFSTMDDEVTKTFIETFEMERNEQFTGIHTSEVLGITVMKLQDKQFKEYEAIDQSIHLSEVNIPGLHHAGDVIRRHVNKGEAVKKVLEVLNISEEEAIAFGDGMNDKEMMLAVGTSFAMGNAHPDLFDYATHRTTDVEDAGIYNGLKQLGIID